jgi:heme A synthase
MQMVETPNSQVALPRPARAQAAEEQARAAKEQSQKPALECEEWIYRIVVGMFGVVMLVLSVRAFQLTVAEHEVPDLLIALGAGAIGALAGVLALSPKRQ